MTTKYYVDQSGNYLGGFSGYQPPPVLVTPETGEPYEELPPYVYATPPAGAIEVPEPPETGLDKWVNGAWVPHVVDLAALRAKMHVTTFQAHAAIHRSGLYNAVVELMNDPATDFEVKLAWEKAQHFSRLSPTVAAMGAALGLTDQQLDDLFALAATIEA